MDCFLKKFVYSLLVNPERKSKNEDHINFLRNIVVRGDSDHFCKGDIIVPLKSPKIMDVVMANQHSPLHTCVTTPCDNSFTIVKEFLSSVSIPVEKICVDRGLLCFSLKREDVMESTLRVLLEAGQNYGKSRSLQSTKVIIVHDTSQERAELVDRCRGRVLLEHVVKNLKFAGAEVQTIHYSDQNLKDSKSTLSESDIIEGSDNSMINGESKRCKLSEDVDSATRENVIRFCFRCSGKSEAIDNTQWGKVLKYKHLINTKTGKAWRVPAEDLLRILLNELRLAMELKHGDIDSEDGNRVLRSQAVQCMTLFLLSKNYSDDLRIDVVESSQNTKDWAFVLYNYARLKMIFKSYESQVSQGSMPPLPDADEVDFSLLKHDEEWVLVWEFIVRWPEIMEEFASATLKDPSRMKTSALAKFLHMLSHRFSVYYRRYRVLVSGEFQHLMPLMFARLYLLKSLQILMEICFDLMGVDSPPDCM